MAIQEYLYNPDNPPAVVGVLTTGQTVTIEIWEVPSGTMVNLTSNACQEIGTTGKYSFSTVNITVLPKTPTQYSFRMSDGGGNTVTGDFILKYLNRNDGGMPDLNLTPNSPYITTD